MSLWKIALRSIQHRPLASFLTAFSMSLGVALVVAVLVIHAVIAKSFTRGAQGYYLIVGAKGSPLELTLNTVFHLREPIGTISYEHYRDLTGGGVYAPEVDVAIPMCMGGNYKGFRVVGTIPEMFDELEYRHGEQYEFQEPGRNFSSGGFREAVIGANVARKTGLEVGGEFKPVHGFDAEQGDEHDAFEVVGVLKPTGTPNDNALFINIEGFWEIHENHDHDGHGAASHADDSHADEPGHAEDTHAHDPAEGDAQTAVEDHRDDFSGRRITAILVKTHKDANLLDKLAMPALINEEPDVQAVEPAKEIIQLFEGIVGNIQRVLLTFAILIVVVAGIGMMVSIYNSMSDRRHEIAVMRALGARRRTVLIVILLESILLSLGGGAFGVFLGHGLIGLLGPSISEHTGVAVHALAIQSTEFILIPGLIILASAVGFLPAMVAYRTDVAQSLTANP